MKAFPYPVRYTRRHYATCVYSWAWVCLDGTWHQLGGDPFPQRSWPRWALTEETERLIMHQKETA